MSDREAAPLIEFKDLGRRAFEPVWREMRELTDSRTESTADQVWFVEHDPIFTLGMNGSPEHVLRPGKIPVLKIDRGGQVTYHGPGQLVVYPLVSLKRLKLNVSALVCALERAVVASLAEWKIEAYGKRDAPGVYVDGAKIASIGLRIRRGASYHGLAINVAMDLEPFQRINPCGFSGLQMTQVTDLAPGASLETMRAALTPHLARELTSAAA